MPQCRAQVYLDEGSKPEVGEGLNREAEVTLLKVFRMDKATQRPSTDPTAIEKFTKKLKKLTSEQGARFISYNPEGGIWKFEVEHFSRCAFHVLQRLLSSAGHNFLLSIGPRDDISAASGNSLSL